MGAGVYPMLPAILRGDEAPKALFGFRAGAVKGKVDLQHDPCVLVAAGQASDRDDRATLGLRPLTDKLSTPYLC